MPDDPREHEQRQGIGEWGYTLTLVTVVLLCALGVQSLLGTVYVWWAQRSVADWERVGYAAYAHTMDLIGAPLLIALIVVMGLCVPRRLLARRTLAFASAVMLAVGVAVALITGAWLRGLAAYLALAAVIQLLVVVLTLAGSARVSFLSRGRLAKAGSGLLHLGFVLIALSLAALRDTSLWLPAFWIATMLVLAGSALAFYARP